MPHRQSGSQIISLRWWRHLTIPEIVSFVFVSVRILANNALRAHHASAHGGLSANVLLDICLSFFEMILTSCWKLCLTVEHSIL